jgi:threonine synthase
VKFYDVVEPVIGETVPVPAAIEEQLKLTKQSSLIGTEYAALKDALLAKY